jgi:hypothetical protein
MATEQHTSIK